MTSKRKFAQCPALTAALALVCFAAAPAGSQDDASPEEIRAGKLAFNTSCRTCHSIREGDNRLGPNLYDIVGRQAGSADYGYSRAMATSDIVWDAETLDRFIENPDAVVPGNNMQPYGGISDETVRASIVTYMSEGLSGSGDDE